MGRLLLRGFFLTSPTEYFVCRARHEVDTDCVYYSGAGTGTLDLLHSMALLNTFWVDLPYISYLGTAHNLIRNASSPA